MSKMALSLLWPQLTGPGFRGNSRLKTAPKTHAVESTVGEQVFSSKIVNLCLARKQSYAARVDSRLVAVDRTAADSRAASTAPECIQPRREAAGVAAAADTHARPQRQRGARTQSRSLAQPVTHSCFGLAVQTL